MQIERQSDRQDMTKLLVAFCNFVNVLKKLVTFRQAEIHTTELLVPEASVSEIELAIEKLKNHKSPGIDQVPAELIKAGGRTIAVIFINLLFRFGIGRNCLREKSGRSRS
jgi:hypothetical protein